jgi:lysophospholipase L1-like esterase
MKLEYAGAAAVFVAAGAVGAVGVYLTWGLVAGVLHPSAFNEALNEGRRTVLTQPLPGDPAVVGQAPPAAPDGQGPKADAPSGPQMKAGGTPEPKNEIKVEIKPDTKAADAAPPDAEPPVAALPPSEAEVPDPKVFIVGGQSTAPGRRGITILQIGDSHTSADFLTGELRRRLQAKYGRGGTGYMTAGHPHIGVRSSTLKITASPGWTYKSLQRPDARIGEFWLSGYDAVASMAGETMSVASETPLAFDMIEIEAIAQPGGGAIDIKVDGSLVTHHDLAASRLEPVIIRLLPQRGPTEKLRDVTVTTTSPGIASLSSVSIYNNHAGLTYNSVGYVGARVGLLDKMSDKLLADDLKRINPQIVVLSFGTNEASNEHFDPAQYARTYEHVVDKIRAALPGVAIAVISPPDFNELSPGCPKEKVAEATCRRPGAEAVASTAASGPALASASECVWRTPARLAQVRDVQREIAKRDGLVYWNWATIMPAECGAHQWFSANPPLMTRDHVHFTAEGYRRSAEEFLNTLTPMIEKVRAASNAVSNN